MTIEIAVKQLSDIRKEIGGLDNKLLYLKADVIAAAKTPDRAEAIASIQLAHRHLEDARMRCGKVIQALEGGVSILDHPEVKALIAKIRADV
jgi:hypothetical protein